MPARLLTLELFDRHPGRVLAGIGVLFAVAYVSALTLFPRTHGRLLDGDTIQYYAYLRSLVIDHDVDFTNDYQLLYAPADAAQPDNIWLTSRTRLGRPTNLMSIGPALLWAPFFIGMLIVLGVGRLFGLGVALDGMAAPFPVSVGVAGIVYATVGAYMCYRACRLLFPQGPAFWAALAGWLGTPAVYYSVISPAYSHATSLFACALFVFFWLKDRGQRHVGRFVWLGVLAGIAALVRWQDAVIVGFPLLELAHEAVTRRLTAAGAGLRAIVMAIVMIAMLVPQFLAWHAIYGDYLLVPQGENFMRWTRPAVVQVLFSLRHGLFSWTPLVLIAVVGLLDLTKRDRLLGWSALLVVAVAVYINASVVDWWAGEAFGARRFVGYTVLFALGLGSLFARRWWQDRAVLLRWSATVLIVYNLLFLVQYQLFMRGFQDLAPYPATARQVFVDRLVLPYRLLRLWIG